MTSSSLFALGSPPQVRGKLLKALSWVAIQRITPAGAGKTSVFGVFFCASWDHPRRCGENAIQSIGFAFVFGSPPQVRGKPFERICVKGFIRITPAGAGKTKSKTNHHCDLQDHPRRCGENDTHPDPEKAKIGSPPQVRGKQFKLNQMRVLIWITPADAGKTMGNGARNHRQEDHPRGCGENISRRCPTGNAPTSPPRMRGKHQSNGLYYPLLGITPADAGKTIIAHFISSCNQDHPRGCGENFLL